MRLIDADKLKKTIQDLIEYNNAEDFDKGYNIALQGVIEKIDNAPTVDFPDWYKVYEDVKGTFERPQGEWIELRDYDNKCSLCGNTMMDKWSYCPSCGAKMEE